MNTIKFTNVLDVPNEYSPKPASKSLPQWYKDLDSYRSKEKIPDGKGFTTATIKRCMPVFDAMESGYILVSHADVYISQVNGQPHYEWPSSDILEFHHISQAPTYPGNKVHKELLPKWVNPWAIETPKGYSTLFVQPFHRESVFTILPGVVDTDLYHARVNFPFVLNDINFEGLIPAGTPIAQVIPFKRDSWKMVFGNKEDIYESNFQVKKLRSRIFDSYKSQFRQAKEYK
jgi:hypothetical protein